MAPIKRNPFEDARRLARVGLHKFTPPYPGAGARVEAGALIYPVQVIDNPEDYHGNPLVPGRHAGLIVGDL